MQIKSQEITFYTHQIGKNVKVRNYQMLAKMLNNRTSHTLPVGVQIGTTALENNLAFSSKFDGACILWLSTSLLEKYPMETHECLPGTSSRMFKETLFIIVKAQHNPNVHWQENQ